MSEQHSTMSERVDRLEAQVGALVEAIEALARGLEGGPMSEPRPGEYQKAARRAHELALLARASDSR